MRKRVPILLGGGVAIFIASQFFDFGLGFREGGSSVTTQAPNQTIESAKSELQEKEPLIAPEEPNVPPNMPTEALVIPPAVVDVVINSDQYLVMTDAAKPEQRQAMTLDEIITMVNEVPGEPSGIKIRIARTPDAMAVTDAAIMNRLNSAGVNPDSIDSRRQLVSLNNNL